MASKTKKTRAYKAKSKPKQKRSARKAPMLKKTKRQYPTLKQGTLDGYKLSDSDYKRHRALNSVVRAEEQTGKSKHDASLTVCR
jgi:hypothetical protein